MKNINFLKSNLIAHRGIHNSEIPENTLPAFYKCVDKKIYHRVRYPHTYR